MEILRRIASGIVIAGGATVVSVVVWVLIVAAAGFVNDIVRKDRLRSSRIAALVIVAVALVLVIGIFWLLGGLRIGPA